MYPCLMNLCAPSTIVDVPDLANMRAARTYTHASVDMRARALLCRQSWTNRRPQGRQPSRRLRPSRLPQDSKAAAVP